MAKNGNGSAKLVSPLYVSGKTNGAVAGPRGGISIPDGGKLTKSGQAAPGGGKK